MLMTTRVATKITVMVLSLGLGPMLTVIYAAGGDGYEDET